MISTIKPAAGLREEHNYMHANRILNDWSAPDWWEQTLAMLQKLVEQPPGIDKRRWEAIARHTDGNALWFNRDGDFPYRDPLESYCRARRWLTNQRRNALRAITRMHEVSREIDIEFEQQRSFEKILGRYHIRYSVNGDTPVLEVHHPTYGAVELYQRWFIATACQTWLKWHQKRRSGLLTLAQAQVNWDKTQKQQLACIHALTAFHKDALHTMYQFNRYDIGPNAWPGQVVNAPWWVIGFDEGNFRDIVAVPCVSQVEAEVMHHYLEVFGELYQESIQIMRGSVYDDTWGFPRQISITIDDWDDLWKRRLRSSYRLGISYTNDHTGLFRRRRQQFADRWLISHDVMGQRIEHPLKITIATWNRVHAGLDTEVTGGTRTRPWLSPTRNPASGQRQQGGEEHGN
jgi:hypothetical protein